MDGSVVVVDVFGVVVSSTPVDVFEFDLTELVDVVSNPESESSKPLPLVASFFGDDPGGPT